MPGAMDGYERCNGCGVCTLSCPVWQQSHDVVLTFMGRALALQRGAKPEDLRDSIGACLLCGSCEPVCPMGVSTVGVTLRLRAALNGAAPEELTQKHAASSAKNGAMLIPDAALRERSGLLERVKTLLGIAVAEDDGADIAGAFEAGHASNAQRAGAFLKPLAGLREVVTSNGIFKRYIRGVLPGLEVTGLGEALVRLPAVRAALRPTDLYVIEARAYNADFDRCAPFYTALGRQTGCAMNLDLQRIAIPTGACRTADIECKSAPKIPEQIRWIFEGRNFQRIVVEAAEDIGYLRENVGVPVLHVAELGGEALQ